MSKDRLVLDEDRNGLWFISWCFPESGDMGAFLGEGHPYSPDSKDEHHIASRAAFGAAVPYLRNHDGYRWETRGDTQRALRAAKAALLDARSKVPLPDWAKQALAAGWKMPKGWKP
jgi:hypothetical protein